MSYRSEQLGDLWTFTPERVYLLVAIARSKENEDVRATDQPTMRKVVENRDELQDKLDQLEHATSRFPHEYRLYATVNGRNAWEAYAALQKEMVKAQNESRKSGQPPRLLKRIDHQWKSILHQPRCRDEKRFVWDLDTPKGNIRDMLKADLSMHTDIVWTTATPNGFHIVTEPFNFNELGWFVPEKQEYRGYECERKNDDMVFVDFIGTEVTLP